MIHEESDWVSKSRQLGQLGIGANIYLESSSGKMLPLRDWEWCLENCTPLDHLFGLPLVRHLHST